jgi:tRNA C32,U32 (ribose-2'-O)-methylase TrmJ
VPSTHGRAPNFRRIHEGRQRYDLVRYIEGDAFVFGPESRGLPAEILGSVPEQQCLRVPMVPGSRSLNLSNSVAVVLYEAWRQVEVREGDLIVGSFFRRHRQLPPRQGLCTDRSSTRSNLQHQSDFHHLFRR